MEFTQKTAPESGAASADQTADARPDDAAELRRLLIDAKEREAEARRALSLLDTIVNQLPVGVKVQVRDGAVLFVNETEAHFGRAAENRADPTPPPPPMPDAAPGSEGADAATAKVFTTEDRISGPNGERVFLRCCKPARILGQDVVLSASIDFTERKQGEIELSKRAYFDDLTDLPNRALIEEHVEHLFANPDSYPRFALAFIDIDNFKHINDYYTHAVGDALLVKLAQRISSHIRSTDVLGRISGDEFLLVLNPLSTDADLSDRIDGLLQLLKEPFQIEGFEILTSASVGLSVFPDHGTNYEMLRRAADTAMYRVKEGTKGGAALFDREMGRAMNARMAQEQRLRLAVRDGRFCCAFQPKVDIRTQEIVGVEALIRLRDEDGEIHVPGPLIGLAIELGLIDELTYLALDQIVASIDLIDEAFGKEATISINIAAKQAGNLKFMRNFCDELKATSYAGRFMIEVTEDAFVAKNVFQSDVLPMLREMGTRVSIDDFGTGYSSLASLADITADEIKIDRSFITDIHKRSRSQSILRAIEALSEALHMTVIAEGVETVEEVTYLQGASRIRLAQGYYFSRPVLLEELTPMRQSTSLARSVAPSREGSAMRVRG